jgi:hypothetical protein
MWSPRDDEGRQQLQCDYHHRYNLLYNSPILVIHLKFHVPYTILQFAYIAIIRPMEWTAAIIAVASWVLNIPEFGGIKVGRSLICLLTTPRCSGMSILRVCGVGGYA